MTAPVAEAFTSELHPHAASGPGGGQFVSKGGSTTGKAKAKKTSGPPAGSMAYNRKKNRGTGYGIPGGDRRVRALQMALNRLGIPDAHGRPLALDGKLGPKTTNAIVHLQQRLGLKADGIVTPAFLAQIRNLRAVPMPKKAGKAAPRKAPQKTSSAREAAPPTQWWDIDPIGELDEATEALIAALDQIAPNRTTEARLSGQAFNDAHKRGADGKFIKMIDRIIGALYAHEKDGGEGGDPLKDFNRTQLRNAAKSRGITLTRGEDEDSIKRKLIADITGSSSPAPAVKPAKAAPKKSAPRKKKAEPPLPIHKPSKGRDLLPGPAARDPLSRKIYHQSTAYHGKAADPQLAAVGAMQGYDDVPTVATKDEMDRLLATGDYIEAWRGVIGKPNKTAAQMHDDFRTGPAYYGWGVFGNGYYFATERSIAESYSDQKPGSLLRVLIPKSAKIRPHEDVLAETQAFAQAAGGSRGDTLYDEGLYATAKGIDGLEIGHQNGGHIATDGKPAFNWLNRSVLIVEEG